mmetsp:Transcript_28253/g.79764  ORF Transcript_28253/g.79764 Transcript_28253/m.79764 type:complete len:304 (+) Transcript_28253:328-1239(+)
MEAESGVLGRHIPHVRHADLLGSRSGGLLQLPPENIGASGSLLLGVPVLLLQVELRRPFCHLPKPDLWLLVVAGFPVAVRCSGIRQPLHLLLQLLLLLPIVSLLPGRRYCLCRQLLREQRLLQPPFLGGHLPCLNGTISLSLGSRRGLGVLRLGRVCARWLRCSSRASGIPAGSLPPMVVAAWRPGSLLLHPFLVSRDLLGVLLQLYQLPQLPWQPLISPGSSPLPLPLLFPWAVFLPAGQRAKSCRLPFVHRCSGGILRPPPLAFAFPHDADRPLSLTFPFPRWTWLSQSHLMATAFRLVSE